MAIDEEQFKKLLKISRINVSSSEEEVKIKNHIGLIVDWVSDIKNINTDGVKPLVNIIADLENDTILDYSERKTGEDPKKVKQNLKITIHDGIDYFTAPVKVVD